MGEGRAETRKFELELNTLNYLVGKEYHHETLELFTKQPDLIRAIPSLIASRDKILDILVIDDNDNMTFEQLNFSKIDTDRRDYVDFAEKSGLLDFLQNKAKRSLVDYVYGLSLDWTAMLVKIEVERQWKVYWASCWKDCYGTRTRMKAQATALLSRKIGILMSLSINQNVVLM